MESDALNIMVELMVTCSSQLERAARDVVKEHFQSTPPNFVKVVKLRI